ncbi:MAG: CBASS cGAMP-activated phospholipase [Coriobacteriia bacterium]
MTDRSRFRILALDGGGVKGAYTAAVLASIEEDAGKPIAEHFDLIAGTSTGGILALGLGLGLPAPHLLQFYLERGPDIFPSTGIPTGWWRSLRQLFAPRHSADQLQQALADIFGQRRLGESRQRLLIPSYDAVAGDVHVFKTAHDRRVREDYKRLAVEVARATSAAPVYLPLFSSSWGQQFLDGGLWANCPSAIALHEAIGVLGVPLDDIDVLSLGTTDEPFTPARPASAGGLLHYGGGIIKLMMQAQERASWAQTQLLTNRRAMRINTTVNEDLYSLDGSRWIGELVSRGRHDGRHHAQVVIERFMYAPAPVFTPVYVT